MTGIRADVEKRVYELLSELGDRVGAERVQQLFESAITGAARTKKVVDQNVETLLSMANIPSRRDYDRMRTKLDALQASIVNLNRTVADLQQRLGAAARARTAKPRRARKAKPTSKHETRKRAR